MHSYADSRLESTESESSSYRSLGLPLNDLSSLTRNTGAAKNAKFEKIRSLRSDKESGWE